jgi:hypothetical protein
LDQAFLAQKTGLSADVLAKLGNEPYQDILKKLGSKDSGSGIFGDTLGTAGQLGLGYMGYKQGNKKLKLMEQQMNQFMKHLQRQTDIAKQTANANTRDRFENRKMGYEPGQGFIQDPSYKDRKLEDYLIS